VWPQECNRPSQRPDAHAESYETQKHTFASSKAVLKPPHSKRWRDCQASSDLAKRLECGAFTAAFVRWFAWPSVNASNGHERLRAAIPEKDNSKHEYEDFGSGLICLRSAGL
jgi:hypothetical protein